MLKPPFKLYRYRSLEPCESFDHVKDIIRNNRFHTAVFTELNDPMEGLFTYEYGMDKGCLDGIIGCKKRLRICSFSKSADNPLLWAHYADGFRGICIEITVAQGDCANFEFAEVEYPRRRLYLTKGAVCDTLAPEFARQILTQKWKAWKTEKEVRILSEQDFVPIEPPLTMTRILLGIRIHEDQKTAIRQMTPPDVEVCTTKIDPNPEKDLIIVEGQVPRQPVVP